jgi:hypothetical protein
MRTGALLLLIAIALPLQASANPTLGFVEHFTSTISTWNGGATYSNPGTGGALGAGDGYLRLARTGAFGGQLATRSDGLEYHGDWIAANINKIDLCLNDVGANQNLEVHVVVGNAANFWICKTGFSPPENSWALFSVNLNDSTNFQQIIGAGESFASALRNADRLHIRHDIAPYQQAADDILGEFGIDEIVLGNSTIGVGPLPAGGPRPIELSAPYPNPSRGAVVCAFETFDAGAVRVAIVDAAGRLVRTEMLAGSAPGRRTWMWDGMDSSGRLAPAGVYRVRVTGASGGTSRPFVRLD